ncbi:MAG: hypothetical protein ACLQPN_09205 [Bryobacteraceae bacterium]
MTRRFSVPVRLGLALLLFFALDALAFRTGWYVSILEPNSTAGFLETYLNIEEQRPIGRYRQVLAVGDSRMGLKTRVADLLTAETGCSFGTISVPGTTPRCWYYMLREVDPDCDRYAAILVPLDTYDDRSWDDLADRDLDINYLTPLLRVGDLPGFVFSYPSWSNRAHAAEAVLLKGLAYQHDFQAFLEHPRTRMQYVRLQEEHAREWYYNAVWERHSLAGMSVDWNAKTVALPAWLEPAKRREVQQVLLDDPPPYSADFARYRRHWLRAILDRYRGSRTRFLFLRLPRGPVVRPETPPPDPHSVVRRFAAAGRIILLPEHMFDSLEHPELFGDALHLNEEGGYQFSMMLAGEVGRVLASAPGDR